MTLNTKKNSAFTPKPPENGLQDRKSKRFGILNEEEFEIPTETVSGIPPSVVILKMARKDTRKTSLLINCWLRRQ